MRPIGYFAVLQDAEQVSVPAVPDIRLQSSDIILVPMPFASFLYVFADKHDINDTKENVDPIFRYSFYISLC